MIAPNSIDSALLIKTPDENQWVDIVRAMKPGAHLLLFSKVKEHHVGAIAAEDAGLEIRDTIAWVSSGENCYVNMVLIAMARKPLQGTVAANVLQWGTGGLNVDGCRVGTGGDKGVWPVTGRPADRGSMAGPMGAAETDQTSGRWPANLILTYPEDEYKLRDNITPQQLAKLAEWMNENA